MSIPASFSSPGGQGLLDGAGQAGMERLKLSAPSPAKHTHPLAKSEMYRADIKAKQLQVLGP